MNLRERFFLKKRSRSWNILYEYDDHISQTFAYNELRNDRLILGAYSYAGYGHAVVICGVNQTVKSYAFMDPAVGEYCAGTIYTSSGKRSFISESSGNRFRTNGNGYYDGKGCI